MSGLTPFASKSLIMSLGGGGPGGGGGGGSGMLLFSDNFEHSPCNFGPDWTNIGIDTHYNPAIYTVETPFTMPVGAPPPGGSTCGMHYFYKNGVGSDNTPIQVFKNLAITEIFLRWYEYYKSPFIWPSAQKQFRIGNSSGPGPQIIQAIGTNSDGSQNIGLLGSEGATVFYGDSDNTDFPSPITLDAWHKFEVYFRKGSGPNIADGQCAMRIDNAWFVNFENVITHNNGLPFDYFWIGGNNTWNGSGPGGHTSVPQNQHRYITEISVFDGLPAGIPAP